ncbi:MAG TPA: 4Fe-4S binding protein [Candidatus Dormibacteraeota bacterium]|nr:4Fe-4S binding protein [Candidatus Dormibacteraeota bacterium]
MGGASRPRSRYGRWRAVTLTAVYVLAAIHFAHWWLAGRTLAPLELNEVLHTLHLGIVTAGFLFMAVVLLATAVVGRFFCSWACHILALQDLAAWLLDRIGIHPKPLRSRALAWVPFATMAYLFIWPQVARIAAGEPAPTLRIVSGTAGWTSFVTDDMWRNLPSPGMALLTFAVCGFVIVYVLGSRSFCYAVCPYGVLFGAADRVAPGRITAVGDCRGCGICTATCQSQIRVHEEIARHGTVVDPRCLRDLDCVSVCPDGTLRFGFTRPTLFRSWDALRGTRRRPAFSTGEDVALALLVLVALPAFRGLYDAVPLLLAVALAVLFAVAVVFGWRLVRQPRLAFNTVVLKSGGRLSRAGVGFATGVALFAAFAAHSALMNWHGFRAEQSLRALSARGGVAPGTVPDEARDALAHLRVVDAWGLARSPNLHQRLASLSLVTGDLDAARAHLDALLAARPDEAAARLRLGQVLAQLGRFDDAARELTRLAGAGPETLGQHGAEIRDVATATLARLPAAAHARRDDAP